MKRRAATGDAGFILVETIVAFLILSIALGVAVQAVSQATASIRRSQAAAAATLAAGDILAARAGSIDAPGSWTGRHRNGAGWRLVAQRLPDDGPQPLYALVLEVRPAGAAAPMEFRTFVVGAPLP